MKKSRFSFSLEKATALGDSMMEHYIELSDTIRVSEESLMSKADKEVDLDVLEEILKDDLFKLPSNLTIEQQRDFMMKVAEDISVNNTTHTPLSSRVNITKEQLIDISNKQLLLYTEDNKYDINDYLNL